MKKEYKVFEIGDKYGKGTITSVNTNFITVKHPSGYKECYNIHGLKKSEQVLRDEVEEDRVRDLTFDHNIQRKDKVWQPHEEVELLRLKCLHGVKNRELGEMFNVSPEAINSKVYRLKQSQKAQ